MIGFFLHSAFPNSQIIQILPQRVEILKSLLCSDLIGFHLFEYAKNFVTSCKKLLDLNYEFRRGGILGIDVDGRRYVSLRIGHVGIEKECINEVIVS
jgi:trehalose 6-phosphate synthase/phosphatase